MAGWLEWLPLTSNIAGCKPHLLQEVFADDSPQLWAQSSSLISGLLSQLVSGLQLGAERAGLGEVQNWFWCYK